MTNPLSILVTRFLSVACLVLFLGTTAAFAQTTTFVYQGRLTDGGTAANGTYDMQFMLYDALSGGNPQGSPNTVTRTGVNVTNAVFTVQLDFGAGAFPGADRFLDIGVKHPLDASYTPLVPRQQITSSPYSIRTLSAGAADSLSSACVLCVTDSHISGVSGSKVTGTVADARLSSNVALLTATQTLTNKTLTAPGISTISNTGTLTLPTSTDTLVGRATTDTLTNKTIDSTTNTVTTDKLRSATTVVDVKSAAAPTAGQVLTATSATAAVWQSPAGAANYVYAYDTTDQSIAFLFGFQNVTYSNNGAINGWVHTPGSANFTCPVAGLYLVQYYGRLSASIVNIFNATMLANINGVEIPGSQSSTIYNTLSGLTTAGPTISKSFIVSAVTGDVLTIQFEGGNTSMFLSASSGFGTVKPSSSITITRIQ